MTKDEYRSAVLDVAYLASCAVNGRIPDPARVATMDMVTLYQAADRHLLTGITATALESAGVKDEAFTQAKGKAIRKVAAFDIERSAVLARLEEAGIWYMPLKGCVLKELYPALGTRQMADNDILFDASRNSEVRKIMEELGFATDENYGRGIHDHFLKLPVCNFEMHRALFADSANKAIYRYYLGITDKMVKDEGRNYGYHLSPEDFYIYLIAHEYKHYSGGGTGMRSLLDTYVYCKKKGDKLDWSYIDEELNKLGLKDFEARNRSLALHLLTGEALTAADREMLDYILSSGTYGTVSNKINNVISQYGNGAFAKTRYVLSRIFLPLKTVKTAFPLFIKIPILLPFLPVYRLFKGLTQRKEKLRAEFKALREHE